MTKYDPNMTRLVLLPPINKVHLVSILKKKKNYLLNFLDG
jgi:hypothetical protein